MRLSAEQLTLAIALKGKVTQREAAKQVGCGQSHISRLWNAEHREKARMYSLTYRQSHLNASRQHNVEYHRSHKDPAKRRQEYALTLHEELIYIVYSELQGLVKIGRTRNVVRRLKELRIGGPDIIIVTTFPGNRLLELAIHDTLGEKRFNHTSREWFRITPAEAVKVVQSVMDQEGIL